MDSVAAFTYNRSTGKGGSIMKFRMSLPVLVTFLVLLPSAAPAQEAAPSATLESCAGEVTVGSAGSPEWKAAVAGMPLVETQIIRTGPQGQATVRFAPGDLTTLVGSGVEVTLADLLLKAKLEKMRNKVAVPGEGAEQTKMQVTPLTGVRGTEEAPGKAEEPKRDHIWTEDAPKQ